MSLRLLQGSKTSVYLLTTRIPRPPVSGWTKNSGISSRSMASSSNGNDTLVWQKAGRVDIGRRNALLERKRRCDDVDRLLYAPGIHRAQGRVRLGRKLLDLPHFADGDVGVDLAMVLVHDFAGLLWISHRAFQSVERRLDEAPDEPGIHLDHRIGSDNPIAVIVEPCFGVRQPEHFLRRRRSGKKRLPDRVLPDSVDPF